MAIVSASDLQDHLNLAAGQDATMLARLVDAAQDHLQRQLGFTITSRFGGVGQEAIPPSLAQAVLLLAAHWYENREASLVGVNAQPLPFGVADIVADFRDYTYG